MMNELLNDAALKPWQKTSYFVLLVAVVIGGAAITFGTSLYLPQLTYLTDEQRGEILQTMFDSWATLSSIVVGGNVAARGGLTLLKQWLQNQLVKNAAGIPETPQTVNAGGDVTVNAGEMPPSQHQSQNTVPAPAPVVEPLPVAQPLPVSEPLPPTQQPSAPQPSAPQPFVSYFVDPTVPRNEEGANEAIPNEAIANEAGANAGAATDSDAVGAKAKRKDDIEGGEDYERTPA